MSYYDRIAKQWHETTGYQGGSFKRHVLNDVLLDKISAVSNKAILELGAGQMRLPVVPRGVEEYGRLLEKAGFSWQATDVYPTEKVLNEKAGLRELGSKPLALVLKCWR